MLLRYPGEIVPKVLYLGDWEHAQQTERMDELNIRRCAAAQRGQLHMHEQKEWVVHILGYLQFGRRAQTWFCQNLPVRSWQ